MASRWADSAVLIPAYMEVSSLTRSHYRDRGRVYTAVNLLLSACERDCCDEHARQPSDDLMRIYDEAQR